MDVASIQRSYIRNGKITFTQTIGAVILILIVSWLLVEKLHIPIQIVAIFVGVEILNDVFKILLKFNNVRKLASIKEESESIRLKRITWVDECNNLQTSILSFVMFLASTAIVYVIFADDLNEYINTQVNMEADLISLDLIIYVVLVAAVFKIISLIIQFAKLYFINRVDTSKNVDIVAKRLELIYKRFRIIKSIPGGILAFSFLFFFGIPMNILFIPTIIFLIVILVSFALTYKNHN